MDLPTVIAIIALLISIGSFGVTVWATRLSKRSLDHAIEVQKHSEEKEFEKLRAELLMQIADVNLPESVPAINRVFRGMKFPVFHGRQIVESIVG